MTEIGKMTAKQAAGDDHEAAAVAVVAAQAQVWEHISGFISCGALRCMLQLRLPSIIHAHGGRMGLEQLAAELAIQSSPSKLDRLRRILRYLAHKKLLCMVEEEVEEGDGEEERKYYYGLTPASKLLVQGQEKSLEAFVMFVLQYGSVPFIEDLWGSSLEGMSKGCSSGSPGKEDCRNNNGEEKEKWGWAERDKEMNARFMEAMVSYTSVAVEEIVKGVGKWGGLDGDGDGDGVGTLVDVGGNVGQVAGAIAKAFPHVKCSVLELGHVVDAIADEVHPSVTIIRGDMFHSIPKSDVVFMKSVLHDYNDEVCTMILRKCKEAIPAGRGRVILAEIVLDAKATDGLFEARLCTDMDMIPVGGRERTEEEWSRVITGAGFSHYHVTAMAALESLFFLYP